MERDAERGVDWVHLPVIATVARLLCRELTLQDEYLLLENRTFKSKVPGRLRFTDRVGGVVAGPSSHTTGHAGPHPAVQ
jgi:hypothetical protein